MSNKLPCILVVDDSAMTRAMIKRVIDMTELPVELILEAADGLAGLELMKSRHVDLVLADLNMPVMGGTEMIERMRREPALKSIPVLVVSAQPDPEQIQKLKASGVAGYLPKPFKAEAVRELIEPLLKSRPESPAPANHETIGMKVALTEVIGEALETMAFITPELADTGKVTEAGSERRVVRVHFKGQGTCGSLVLATPIGFGAAMAANCSNYESVSDAEDALKELTNVICGLLLRRRVGGAKGFELSPPSIETVQDEGNPCSGGDSVTLIAEGYPLTVHVTADARLFIQEGAFS
jgi:CheY-like chemotaxis protein